MKRFLTKLALFTAVAATSIGIFIAAVLSVRHKAMHLPETVHTVYMGNSTVECAVDDRLLPGSYNFARSGELIEFVYAKTKALLQANPQIDTLVIGLDDIILFKDFDEPFTSFLNHPYLTSEFTAADWAAIIKNSSFSRWTSYFSHPLTMVQLRQLAAAARQNDIRSLDLGNYRYLERDKLEIDLQRMAEAPEPAARTVDDINPMVIHFFKKIEQICADNDVRLVLLSTPKYKNVHRDSVYRDFRQKYMPDIPLYDHVAVALPDSCYGDCVHLNHRGARQYSGVLAGELKSRQPVP